jgi:hypothetical protein
MQKFRHLLLCMNKFREKPWLKLPKLLEDQGRGDQKHQD